MGLFDQKGNISFLETNVTEDAQVHLENLLGPPDARITYYNTFFQE
jgi:hypothetical protein